MEYIETEDGQIQADFAHRVGQVLWQYESHTQHLDSEERFEATLTLCLLQSLMANCLELIRSQSKIPESSWSILASRYISDDPTLLGLEQSCIRIQWPSVRSLQYREIIECVRHALSHPLPQRQTTLPMTGYTTWKSASGVIEGFRFSHAPWVNKTGSDLAPKFKPSSNKQSEVEILGSTAQEWTRNHGTQGLEVRHVKGGRCQVFLGENPFIPVLKLDISTAQLRTLTLNLSERLSEPLSQVRRSARLSEIET